MRIAIALLSICLSSGAYAKPYQIDHANSHIHFAGEHAGNPFSGTFKQWDATIQFDQDALATFRIEATFQLASAHTGNSMYDGTLPTPDWFDIANHPSGTFSSTQITHIADNLYRTQGTLTLRGTSLPVAFNITLTPEEPNIMQAQGELTLNRLAYAIGKGSDPEAEWVSEDITIQLNIRAHSQP